MQVDVNLIPRAEKLVVCGGADSFKADVFLAEAFLSITLIRSCAL